MLNQKKLTVYFVILIKTPRVAKKIGVLHLWLKKLEKYDIWETFKKPLFCTKVNKIPEKT